jgi:hypothetical protein
MSGLRGARCVQKMLPVRGICRTLHTRTHTQTHTHTRKNTRTHILSLSHTQESSLGDLHRDLKSATPKRSPRLQANFEDEPRGSTQIQRTSSVDNSTSLSEVQLTTLKGPDFASAMLRNGNGASGGGRDWGGGSRGLFSPEPSLSSSFFVAGKAMRLPMERHVDLGIVGPTLDTGDTYTDTYTDTGDIASDAGRERICTNVQSPTLMKCDATVGTLFLDGVAFNDVPGRLLELAREREGGRVQGLAGAIRTPPAPAVRQRSGSPTSPIFRALLQQVVCACIAGALCMSVCIFKLSLQFFYH